MSSQFSEALQRADYELRAAARTQPRLTRKEDPPPPPHSPPLSRESVLMSYGRGYRDPRGGRAGVADVFERPAIREGQQIMEKMAIPKQAFLDPWRESHILYRDPEALPGMNVKKPTIVPENRRSDIPPSMYWLKNSMPEKEVGKEKIHYHPGGTDAAADPPAGGAHPALGSLAAGGRRPRVGSQHWRYLTASYSEEEKRQMLLTNERRRRFSDVKHAPTDTLGLGKPLIPTGHAEDGYRGDFYLPSGPKYRTAPANPWPKLATDPVRDEALVGPEGQDPTSFDPWETTKWQRR